MNEAKRHEIIEALRKLLHEAYLDELTAAVAKANVEYEAKVAALAKKAATAMFGSVPTTRKVPPAKTARGLGVLPVPSIRVDKEGKPRIWMDPADSPQEPPEPEGSHPTTPEAVIDEPAKVLQQREPVEPGASSFLESQKCARPGCGHAVAVHGPDCAAPGCHCLGYTPGGRLPLDVETDGS